MKQNVLCVIFISFSSSFSPSFFFFFDVKYFLGSKDRGIIQEFYVIIILGDVI